MTNINIWLLVDDILNIICIFPNSDHVNFTLLEISQATINEIYFGSDSLTFAIYLKLNY